MVAAAVETADHADELFEDGALVEEGDVELGDDEGAEPLQAAAHADGEFDGVFFGGEEAVGGVAAGLVEEAIDVAIGVAVVVGEGNGGGGCDVVLREHGGEALRPGDAAEGERATGQDDGG